MRKHQWIVIIALIGCIISFSDCKSAEQKTQPVSSDAELMETAKPPIETVLETDLSDAEIPETAIESRIDPPDVLIYTGSTWWIAHENAILEAEITKSRLESAGFHAEIVNLVSSVRNWMLQTTADGVVNVLILYGAIPSTIYAAGNIQHDGSVAENWIETTDGDTILNHADYLGWNSEGDSNEVFYTPEEMLVTPGEEWHSVNVGQNRHKTLRNLMDNLIILLYDDPDERFLMSVTPDGKTLTPSLVNFEAPRSVPLNQLRGEWFAEKIFASYTDENRGTLADPIIVRDGNRGRLAFVFQTPQADDPKGEVAAEIIINYLLAE